ncbi:hypothetical protein [Terriglobus saanensis]|uniref:Outer membrane protein beta-barrel domain-containing protein n=1 Tax=Terriglobus saanensis (strain ATCC BAA-1853 / DSM 23119 / SP1PR4) TaxID=401053 RepID=E8UZ89_TERSS|nr:hypothetical protein [Terriglobus saanensis]ADV82107.1 hypothetical protein AciPR4_1283 [Terriglobus saanensis SP1PR4]
MFRFSSRARLALTVALGVSLASFFSLHGQTSRQRRINATRQARIARTIEQTYTHKWEVAGGGGYLRFRSGEFLQKNNEVTWATSLTRNFTPEWSVVGDVRGAYGNAKIGNNIFNIKNPLITEYTFMAGPQYRFYRKEKTAISAHVLAGAAMGNFDGGSKAIPAYRLGMWDTSTVAAFSVGVNFDYNLYHDLAFRITPTYVGTLFRGAPIDDNTNRLSGSTGSVQNNVGVNVGVVYRWGHQ